MPDAPRATSSANPPDAAALSAPPATLVGWALAALNAARPAEKAAITAAAARWWAAAPDAPAFADDDPAPPDRPARPNRPALVAPRDLPRRGVNSPRGRIAQIHAFAHIELNAIDLAWDMLARFRRFDGGPAPRAFFQDWLRVAADEARHFQMLASRLNALGAAYGDLPAHDGLWRAAEDTAGDVLARLAIAPLTLEARGLDVTPGIIERLDAAGDAETADILRVILRDEIGHVAAGARWFRHVCAARGHEPAARYRALVGEYFKGMLKPPFNDKARAEAGVSPSFYEGFK